MNVCSNNSAGGGRDTYVSERRRHGDALRYGETQPCRLFHGRGHISQYVLWVEGLDGNVSVRTVCLAGAVIWILADDHNLHSA